MDTLNQNYLRDQQETALREIKQLLAIHKWDGLLKLIAEACEDESQLEGDDAEICAQRIDECIESLRDELANQPIHKPEVDCMDIARDAAVRAWEEGK